MGKIGTKYFINEKSSSKTLWHIYLLKVTKVDEDWLEGDVRKRVWVTLDEASAMLDREDIKEWLHDAAPLVKKLLSDSNPAGAGES